MADHSYHVNHDEGAPMDYAEHEATYSRFLWLVKWGIIFNIVLLVAMMVGFYMGGGLIGGTLVFIFLMIAAKIFA